MDFGSLNLENIENIVSSLSEEDIEKLTSMAGEFFASENKNQSSEKKQEAPKQKSSANDFFSGIDPQTMMKIANIISKLNSKSDDPRCELIAALKPLLSEQRRHKADEAIKILKLLSMLPFLGDL